jgi:type III pantothenate kinase
LNLVIDVGNSRVKLAVFDGSKLLSNTALPVLTQQAVLDFIQPIPQKVRHVMLSSVGDAFTELDDFFKGCFTHFFHLSADLAMPVTLQYQSPKTLGMDRLAAVVGGQVLFPNSNVLVIDAGSCITYDFIDAASNYQGGGISPGLQMRFKALHTFTGRLPLIDWKMNDQIDLIGNDTKTSMLSGVMNGLNCEIEGVVERYKKRYNNLQVVATGGDWQHFEFLSKKSIFANPNLVLIGLNELLRYNIEE